MEIAEIITTLGFPAGAFCLMFWLVKDELANNRKAIESNTLAITTLLEHFHNESEAIE